MSMIITNRYLALLNLLNTHTWYRQYNKKLTRSEHKIIIEFCDARRYQDRNKFVHDVNKMFLGVDKKPRNWTLIQELLTVIG